MIFTTDDLGRICLALGCKVEDSIELMPINHLRR